LEPRIDVKALAEMTPLAAVATRLKGHVIDVSGRGVKIQVDACLKGNPVSRDVYRVQSGGDLMLCEVRHCQLEGDGTRIGFEILHWREFGELNRAVKTHAASGAAEEVRLAATGGDRP
jgi:hypothetical protein